MTLEEYETENSKALFRELVAARAVIDAMRAVLATDEWGGYQSDLWGAMANALGGHMPPRYRKNDTE